VLLGLIGAGLAWLYEIDNLTLTRDLPVLAGAVAGLVLAFRTRHGRPVAIGLTIYYVVRTVFNTLRSIEALIVAVVMVVWVGLGPFAGALALALHSVAAGGKLYSEQVESIMAGPLEAIKATGATRLQTIVYAVIPQIIPAYISFTMYRWDINVRMSTIIGFVGGGGIGFLLQQNMNLLNYRGASAQILAIAIVVASMDYLSSRLRERAI
jgi:phosphonate transport system permease protein